MKILEAKQFLIPYTYVKLAHENTLANWKTKVQKSALNPNLWDSTMYTLLRQIRIYDSSDGIFSCKNARILDTDLDGPVVISHSDLDMLKSIDYH